MIALRLLHSRQDFAGTFFLLLRNAQDDTKSAFDIEFDDFIHFLLNCITEENAMKINPLFFWQSQG